MKLPQVSALFIALQIEVAVAGTGVTPPGTSLADIAGQPKASVEQALGESDYCEEGPYGERCSFQQGAIEVFFFDSKADWILYHKRDLQYQAKTLELIGFKATKPSREDRFVTEWTTVEGVKSVKMFAGENGKIEYIFIKTNTNPAI